MKEIFENIEFFKNISYILDAIPIMIIIHDDKGQLIYANQVACSMHGYERDEFMKLNLHDLTTPETAGTINNKIIDILKNKKASFEAVHLRKDKSTFSLYVNVKQIEWGDRAVFISTCTDICGLNITK